MNRIEIVIGSKSKQIGLQPVTDCDLKELKQ
jgi:hypothetical protein